MNAQYSGIPWPTCSQMGNYDARTNVAVGLGSAGDWSADVTLHRPDQMQNFQTPPDVPRSHCRAKETPLAAPDSPLGRVPVPTGRPKRICKLMNLRRRTYVTLADCRSACADPCQNSPMSYRSSLLAPFGLRHGLHAHRPGMLHSPKSGRHRVCADLGKTRGTLTAFRKCCGGGPGASIFNHPARRGFTAWSPSGQGTITSQQDLLDLPLPPHLHLPHISREEGRAPGGALATPCLQVPP